MLVANKKNIKQYAKELLGNEYTEQKEKELINLCTQKTLADYTDALRREHISFPVEKGKLYIGDWGSIAEKELL